MTAVRRSCRLLILAWAVLLAPQASLVHALSHIPTDRPSHQEETDKRNHSAVTVCDTCLAFAQLGVCLPSRFEWIAPAQELPVLGGSTFIAAIPRHSSSFEARAPPASLT